MTTSEPRSVSPEAEAYTSPFEFEEITEAQWNALPAKLQRQAISARHEAAVRGNAALIDEEVARAVAGGARLPDLAVAMFGREEEGLIPEDKRAAWPEIGVMVAQRAALIQAVRHFWRERPVADGAPAKVFPYDLALNALAKDPPEHCVWILVIDKGMASVMCPRLRRFVPPEVAPPVAAPTPPT